MRTINDGFPIKQFNGIDIDTSIQSSSANYYTYSSRVVKFIVIHYTGNTKDTAKANATYFHNGSRSASAHYFVDENNKIHDTYRIDYLRRHIEACREAINDGVDLFGYSPWSAFDLISTHQGITKRYGFIYVDRDEFDLKDMKRIKKDSFYWYQKVCKSNGADLD